MRGATAPWELVLEEEFEGTTLDESLWSTDHPRDSIINDELQAYVPEALSIADGVLVLQAQREPRAYRDTIQPFVSGTINSHRKFSFCFGRFEVRARVPRGQGLWPAAWLLPESLDWPPEIDLFEFRGQEPTRVLMSHHWRRFVVVPRYASGEFAGPDFGEQFHDFAVEWAPDEVRWFVDDALRHRTREFVPAQPMYLNVALAVGGKFPGPPDESTPFPARLEVDRVRVYTTKRKGCAS